MVILPSNTLDRIRAERARRSLYEFVKQSWHVIEPGTPFVDGWHIRAICEHLEAVSRNEIRDLLINMPPRFMKSTIVSVCWPAWEWISNPGVKWLYASYGANLSIRDSIKTRRLITSNWYQTNWGSIFRLTDDQNQKVKFENDHYGYRFSTSVGGQTTGEGGDRIVIDDPHNALEVHSEAHRESVKTWWSESVSTRGNNPETLGRVIVMQRLHEDDLANYVLTKEDGWEHLCLPLRFEPAERKVTSLGWTDPRTTEGELLWSARFNEANSRKLEKRLGSYAAAGQLQQKPSPKGGGMLKAGWFKRFATVQGIEFDRVFLSWDTSFKGTTTSKSGDPDYAVGLTIAQLGSSFYILDCVRGQFEYPQFKRALLDMIARWPSAYSKLIEDKANGSAVISELDSTVPGLIAISPNGGKLARAAAISPILENGHIWIPEDGAADWVEGFVKEINLFPNGKNDDQVDALTQGIAWGMENTSFDPEGYSH